MTTAGPAKTTLGKIHSSGISQPSYLLLVILLKNSYTQRRSDLLETKFLESRNDHLYGGGLHVFSHEDETVDEGLTEGGVGGEVVPAGPGAGQRVDQPGQGRLQQVRHVVAGREEASQDTAGNLRDDIKLHQTYSFASDNTL